MDKMFNLIYNVGNILIENLKKENASLKERIRVLEEELNNYKMRV